MIPDGGLQQRVVAGLALSGPRVPNAPIEQWTRRWLRARSSAAPRPCRSALRAQALDEDVGPVARPQHDLAAAVVPRSTASERLPRSRRGTSRLSLQKRRSPRARVIAAERLDLDDVRAERGEQLRRRRPASEDVTSTTLVPAERVQLAQGCVQTTCGPPSWQLDRFAGSGAEPFRDPLRATVPRCDELRSPHGRTNHDGDGRLVA
jgi:hypothetical protein